MSDDGRYYLGGEGAHRGFFGGGVSRERSIGILVVVGIAMFLTPSLSIWVIAVAVVLIALIILATMNTHRGSLLERRRRRQRWKERRRSMTDRFIPYDAARWDLLTAALEQTRKPTSKEEKVAQRAARADWSRELAAMRAVPDGADGMGWLQAGRGVPGIAWHGPVGEDPYLSVAFALGGQLRGLESEATVRNAAEGFARFLASRAPEASLLRAVQPITRVLPADSALQEWWLMNNLDETVPAEAMRSYEEVLIETGRGAMVQRHYLVGRWPITPDFVATARRHGPDRDGWRALMALEIEAVVRGLTEARMGTVEPLTARGTAAVIRHMQNPSRPVDYMAGLTPMDLGEPSRDEFSAHIVESVDPESGEPVQWWHRTAAISAANLAVAPRTPLWLVDALVGRELDIVRTLSFQIELVPAAEAKQAAKTDVVRDMADQLAETANGKLGNDETSTRVTSAQRRRADLSAGSHHHGANWIGFVTVTAASREELASAVRRLTEVCETNLGIERLDWLDSYQSAASGTTWPIARGLAPRKASFSASAMNMLAGRGEKEAIS